MRFTFLIVLVGVAALALVVYFVVFIPKAEAPQQLHEQTENMTEETGDRQEYYRLNMVLHLVRESGDVNTSRSEELARQIIGGAGEIWRQADVAFDVVVEPTKLPPESAVQIAVGDFGVFEDFVGSDGKLHVFFVNTLPATDSLTLGNNIVIIADETSTNSARLVAQEIGYLFGLERTVDSSERLMAEDGDNTELTENEIAFVQQLLRQSVQSAPGQEETEGL